MRYSDDETFYAELKPRLHHKIGRELRMAGTVVDLGCGSCDLVQYLASTYRQKVTGIDLSGNGFPRKRHTHGGIRFRCLARDARQVDFIADHSVDAVVSMWAWHEMAHPEEILSEIRRFLRPGGRLLIVDFPRGSLAQKLWNEAYYAPGEIVRMLERAGFEQCRAQLLFRDRITWAHAWQPALTEA